MRGDRMRATYVGRDPWERFIFQFGEMLKGGLEVKITYDGTQAGLSLDAKGLAKLATLFERGVPLEVAMGIDLPKMLASLEGEELDISLTTKESELRAKLTGGALSEFRKAVQDNPVDGEALQMVSRLIKEMMR